MSMRETIFDGFFCGFLICNSLRFCEESRKHYSSTEPCMWHRTCQAQQRKANAVAIAAERRTSGSSSRTQAIAQRESLVDTTELERHKLSDARSVLKTLSRIF